MGINFKGYDEYYRSKVPLKFVFLGFAALAVNLIIVAAIQFLTTFPHAGPVDTELLGRMDIRFKNCTILDSADTAQDSDIFADYFVYLVETADGETHAVTLEKHFLADRYRIQEEMTAHVPSTPGEQRIETTSMKSSFLIAIADNSQITDFYADIQFNTAYKTFLLLIAMCAVELIVYGFVFKREELE